MDPLRGGVEAQPVHSSDLFQQYQRVFINVGNWGVVLEPDIDVNDIRDAARLERKLDSKPNLAPDVRSFLNLSDEWYHHSQYWDAYFDCDDRIPHAQDSVGT
jgi:hypothetical protein